MALKILCSGHLVRHPLGGHTWHHLQYLVGFRRLGCEVAFLEHYGWPDSCYNPATNDMTSDPTYGLTYLRRVLARVGLEIPWCYLAEDGCAHGMPREQLAQFCRESDVYFNLSGINWISELEQCRRRVLVDTDPVFTQIGAFGMAGPLSRYHVLFTYGENVHQPDCTMPTAGARWLPTRQPVVRDLWPVTPGEPDGPITSVMNWSAYGEKQHEGRTYGQKDREFPPYYSLPRETGESMELAVGAPPAVRAPLEDGGWRLADPREVTRDPWTYQRYLQRSRAEFAVAKHAYVSTQSGWFSERTCSYLASGRPVVVQDTGFSRQLPTGAGLLSFRNHPEALSAIRALREDYEGHCRAARRLVAERFNTRRVLTALLERSL